VWDQLVLDRCIWFYRNPALCKGDYPMSLLTVLLIVLIIMVVGSIPGAWPYSKDWGRGPIGFLTLMLVIILILMIVGV
jgi:hypothetical protein